MPLIRKDGAVKSPEPNSNDAFTALTSGTHDQRWAAARSIGTAAGGIAALGAALAREADPRVREAIFMSLARAATPESVEAVLPFVRLDDAALRTGALDALRAMPSAVLTVLPRLLADPDADVRLLSCELARALPSGQATPMLSTLLDRETEANVCASAVDVLAELGGPDALPALARCADRFAGEPFLGFAIKVASNRITAKAGDRRG
jgi:hypothetical protein